MKNILFILLTLPLFVLGQTSAEDYNKKGKTKLEVDNFYGAIADFTKAIELNPHYADSYYFRGEAKGDLGDLKGALQDCNKAIELKDDYLEAYYYRASIKKFEEDFYGAISDFTKVLDLVNSDDFRTMIVYLDRAKAKGALRDFKGALQDCNKAIELEPDYAEGYYLRGAAKGAMEMPFCSDFKKACELGFEEACEEIKEINPYCN